MKRDLRKLLISLVIPLAVGGLGALLSRGGMANYALLARPPLSPPGWVFPVVWTLLYLLMGYSAYRVWTSGGDPAEIRRALGLYAAQLFVNFLWPIVFFTLEWRLPAFFLLVGLWILIYMTINAFSELDHRAGDLLLPYILWVTFAGYLNLGTYLMN